MPQRTADELRNLYIQYSAGELPAGVTLSEAERLAGYHLAECSAVGDALTAFVSSCVRAEDDAQGMGDVDREAIALLESLLTSKDLMALWRRLNHGGELEEAMRGNVHLLAGAVLCCRRGNRAWSAEHLRIHCGDACELDHPPIPDRDAVIAVLQVLEC